MAATPDVSHSESRLEDLIWAGADRLGHQLIERVAGRPVAVDAFPCVAEAFIQFEVAEARGGQPSRASIVQAARHAEA